LSSVATIARALLYLRATTFIGQVGSRLRRLKKPKYLFGAVVGAAYVYFFFIQRGTAARRRSSEPFGAEGLPIPPDMMSLILGAGALGLLIAALVSWVIPRRAALNFSEAEIAFLFPAPVSRRQLIHYRLLSSQFALALTAVILAFLFGRGNAFGGNPVTHVIGWWVILATLNLHFTGSSFVITKLLNRTLTTRRRMIATVAVAGAVLVALLLWTWATIEMPTVADLATAGSVTRYFADQLARGPLPWLLAVPKLLIKPYLAPDLGAFIMALGPALLVLAAHYFWVLHSEVSFEEASIARAERRAAQVRAMQQGDWRAQGAVRKAQKEPFSLAGVGRPELAFLWKNLLSTTTFYRPKALLITAAILTAVCLWIVFHPALQPVRFMMFVAAAILCGIVVLFGPLIARQDLRSDLPNADILKTYPLRGWQVVLGELLTPVLIITATSWLTLLTLAFTLPSAYAEWLTLPQRVAAAVALGLLVPPFCALQVLVSNAFTVLFPAWVQSVSNPGEHGLDVLGQRIVFMVGQLLIVVLALLPASIGTAVVFFVANWLTGPLVATVLAVATVFTVLATEAWLGIKWLGQRFEAFDLSDELRP